MPKTVPNPVRVEIDRSADAAYIRLSEDTVARTEVMNDSVFVDLDKLGVTVGIEILGLGTVLPHAELQRRFHIHSSVLGTLELLEPSISDAWKVETTNDSVSRPTSARQLVLS